MDFCFGFSPIKRKRLQAFTRTRVKPLRTWSRRLPDNSRVFVWGASNLSRKIHAKGLAVIRVEDGFLRSVGLGAAFAPPISWVFDSQGLHHWGHSPADLETLLATWKFTDAQREAGQRRRRYYKLTPGGRRMLGEQRSAWRAFAAAINRIASCSLPALPASREIQERASSLGWDWDAIDGVWEKALPGSGWVCSRIFTAAFR